MASELLKNKALIQRLKEPDVPVVNFNLADSAKDYSIESIIEEISTPTDRVADLADDLTPGPLREELKGTFDPTQETYEEYLRRINARYGGRVNFDSGSKPRISREELIRILNESKDLTDLEIANKLNKNYSTLRGKKFDPDNVFAIRKYFGITTNVGKVKPEVATKVKKVTEFLAKEIKKANDGDKFVSQQDILKKVYKKFDLKKQATKGTDQRERLRLDRKAYPILGTLETMPEKIDNVLKRMLLEEVPLNGFWYKTLSERTGIGSDGIRNTLARKEVPTYNVLKDQGLDFLVRNANKPTFGFLKDLSLSEQLEKSITMMEGRPVLVTGNTKFLGAKDKVFDFAFRNWDQNFGKGDVKFFDKNGKEITWDYGKQIKRKTDSFSYKGKKYSYQALNDTSLLKKDFPEVYEKTLKSIKFKNKLIDNPFKPGSRIKVKNLVKKILVDGYEYDPNTKFSLDILHGKDGVKGKPFTDLRYDTRDINAIELSLSKRLTSINPKTKISKSTYNKAFKELSSVYEGVDREQTIIKRLMDQAKTIQTFKGDGKPLAVDRQVKTLLASLSRNPKCKAGFFSGGRVGFEEGSVNLDFCAKDGAKVVNSGKIKSGAEARNFAKFANTAMEIGKISGKGLRAVAKFGVIPEMVIIGADTALRVGSGATFDEAILKATDYIRPGDQSEKAAALEIRRVDPANAETILNLRNFSNQKQKLDSLEQQKEADLALAGDDFAETNIGMTEQEIEKYYEPRIKEQKSKVFESSISEPEERFALAKQAEFEDKRGVLDKQSPIGKFLDYYAEKPGVKELVDLFATGVAREPDVSAQALKNYFADQDLSEEEKKFLRDTTKTSQGAKALLETLKKLEAGVDYPEGSVREKNLQDEERRLLLEAAKGDIALAERFLGSQATFGGEPIINRTDLEPGEIPMYDEEQIVDDIDRFKDFQMNRGIYSIGGRIGFKDGPKDPGRRMFLKLMTGIMALPFVGKFIKPAAPVVQKLANTTTKMPDWFPNFIEKVMFKSSGKKVDADVMLHEVKELPGIKVYRQGDGKIRVEGTNEYGKEYQIDYEPPGYEVVEETGKSYKTKGDFSATEDVPVNMDPDGNMDFDIEVLDDLDQILGSDTRIMEEFATGRKVEKLKSGEFALGKAEADLERAAEEMAESAEYYDEIN